jgi:hypothetical protein
MLNKLDEEHKKIIIENINEVMKLLNEKLPKGEKDDLINLSFNVLTGSLASIALYTVEESKLNDFIIIVAQNLKEYFDANRKD